MTKEKNNNELLTEVLIDMNDRLSSIENGILQLLETQNQQFDILVKLVEQGNTIVSFLKDLQIEDITDEYSDLSFESEMGETSFHPLKELLDEYMEKAEGLKELEEELEKHKDEITNGQVGES